MSVRVLIVDDSAVVRRILSEELGGDPQIEVVGLAADAFEAHDLVLSEDPDVLTLDIEMPGMDGVTFLTKLMSRRPRPVVVVSSLTPEGSDLAFEAMRLGAADVVGKPGPSYTLRQMSEDLRRRVKCVYRQWHLSRPRPPRPSSRPAPSKPRRASTRAAKGRERVLAIGASTGGTVAIESILTRLPERFCGIVITQHMPAEFTESFSKRLDRVCALEVREATDGDEVCAGRVLIAPGSRHMLLRRDAGRYLVGLSDAAPVNRHRPSVDVLFQSVARAAGPAAVGLILTGMGRDGAKGLLEMRRAGSWTIAQDEASCVVFGMPGAAHEIGASAELVGLDDLPARLVALLAEAAVA